MQKKSDDSDTTISPLCRYKLVSRKSPLRNIMDGGSGDYEKGDNLVVRIPTDDPNKVSEVNEVVNAVNKLTEEVVAIRDATSNDSNITTSFAFVMYFLTLGSLTIGWCCLGLSHEDILLQNNSSLVINSVNYYLSVSSVICFVALVGSSIVFGLLLYRSYKSQKQKQKTDPKSKSP